MQHVQELHLTRACQQTVTKTIRQASQLLQNQTQPSLMKPKQKTNMAPSYSSGRPQTLLQDSFQVLQTWSLPCPSQALTELNAQLVRTSYVSNTRLPYRALSKQDAGCWQIPQLSEIRLPAWGASKMFSALCGWMQLRGSCFSHVVTH